MAKTEECKIKRYLLLVQHEVIMYGEDEKAAQSSLFRSLFAKDRTNLKCVYIQEIPLHDEHEPIIDERRAPGS